MYQYLGYFQHLLKVAYIMKLPRRSILNTRETFIVFRVNLQIGDYPEIS